MRPPVELLSLAHSLGDPARGLAIVAEGNVSCREGSGFWVKASGRALHGLAESGVAHCRRDGLAQAVEGGIVLSDAEAAERLVQAADPGHPKPSVEAFFHAWLLGLEGVSWVGHVHPVHCLALLCTEDGQTHCAQRYFPDEVVLCGPATCWLPYVDPGLPLAQAIAGRVARWVAETGRPPRLVALQNHGVIALGATPSEVEAAILMAEKAASVVCLARMGRAALTPLSPGQVRRIDAREDEHYRQRMLRDG
jgi:rhamnose utilization protein RhaD (predicted bifunctional aldolase and dehydrogenase)